MFGMNPTINLLLGQRLAQGSGLEGPAALRYGLVAALTPSAIGLVLAKTLADKEAAANKPAQPAAKPSDKPATDPTGKAGGSGG
jgi:hypothetical protein